MLVLQPFKGLEPKLRPMGIDVEYQKLPPATTATKRLQRKHCDTNPNVLISDIKQNKKPSLIDMP